MSNLLLNVYVYSHRFVLLPKALVLFWGVIVNVGTHSCDCSKCVECAIVSTQPHTEHLYHLPSLPLPRLREHCEYSTSHEASLFPSLPSQGSGNIVRKNRRAGGQAGVLRNAAFFGHNMAATHANSRSDDCLHITGTISSQVKIS